MLLNESDVNWPNSPGSIRSLAGSTVPSSSDTSSVANEGLSISRGGTSSLLSPDDETNNEFNVVNRRQIPHLHNTIGNQGVTKFKYSNTHGQLSNITPVDRTSLVNEYNIDNASGNAKKFRCEICDQGFTRKHNLVSHELIHSTEKPHSCPVCNATFRRIHDLRRHEKLHTGERPFQCDKCVRKFARPDALTRHQNSPSACTGSARKPNTFSDNTGRYSEYDQAMILPSLNRSFYSGFGYDKEEASLKPYQFGVYPKRRINDNMFNTLTTTTTTMTSKLGLPKTYSHSSLYNTHHDMQQPLEEFPSFKNPENPSTKFNSISYPSPPKLDQLQQSDNFVTRERYDDLINYTQALQENLAKMNSRLRVLEEQSEDYKQEENERRFVKDP